MIRLQIPADSELDFLPTFNNPFRPHEPRFERVNGCYICDVEPLELVEWLRCNGKIEAAERVQYHIDYASPRRWLAEARKRLDERIAEGE